MAKEGDWAQLRLPSGEMRGPRRLPRHRRHALQLASTPTSPWARPAARAGSGRRPHNRGVTMNPVDHPMGGGEGRTSGGRHPARRGASRPRACRTRNNKRTDEFIVDAAREVGSTPCPARVKKGPFVDESPASRRSKARLGRQAAPGDQDLVAALDHHPDLRRRQPRWSTTATSSSRCS